MAKVLEKMLADRGKPDAAIEAVDKQIAQLDTQIATATKRVLGAPEDLTELLYAELQKMKARYEALERRRDTLAEQLEEMSSMSVESVLARLELIADMYREADQSKLKALLAATIKEVKLQFQWVNQGKRQIRRFKSGEITLNSSCQVDEMAGTGFEVPIQYRGKTYILAKAGDVRWIIAANAVTK